MLVIMTLLIVFIVMLLVVLYVLTVMIIVTLKIFAVAVEPFLVYLPVVRRDFVAVITETMIAVKCI